MSEPTPEQQSRRGLSLRLRLALLVLATVLPLLAFGLGDVYLRYRADRVRATDHALELAHVLAAEVGADLRARIGILRALALSPALQAGDIPTFRAQAESTAAQLMPGTNILLLEPSGQQVMNLSSPPGDPLPVRQAQENMRRMLASGEPSVSDAYFGIVTRRLVVGIDVPVRDGAGRIIFSLSINPEVDMFSAAVRGRRLPDGWLSAVTDQHGVILARNRDPEVYIGQKASPEFRASLASSGESGIMESVSREGIPTLAAFARLEPGGWAAVVGIPRAELTAPLVRSSAITIGAAGVVLLLGALAAATVARSVTGPIETLQRMASSDTAAIERPSTGLAEVDEVARALLEARNHRERNLAALRDLNETLEHRIAAALAAHDAAQAQLAQAQKMEAVGQLTGGVAHDFNNLLTVIVGNLELIGAAARDEAIRDLAEAAQRAADRGAALTASLLAFSRRQRLDPQVLDVHVLLREFETLVQRVVGANVLVKFTLDPTLRSCKADAAHLEAALLNLVINARDAMQPQGGDLTIATRNATLGPAELSGNPDAAAGAFVAITVDDSGHGMTADVLSRAFEPFFTTKSVGKGSGLGLSQAYGFARQLGGHLTIDSAPGRGTRVTIYLPAADAAPVHGPAPAFQSGAKPRVAGTVLVAEDDADIREMARRTLHTLGCRVLVAADGREALAILRGPAAVDLLFSDVVMPNGVNGVELGRAARHVRPGLRVLLTSGFAHAALEQHGAEGEFDVVAKPYRPAELAARVHAILGQAVPTAPAS